MSSRIASAIHLPDALIHRAPSSFIELLPVLAWVSSGSLPIRADSSRSRVSSAWLIADIFVFIHASKSFVLREVLAVLSRPSAAPQLVWTRLGQSGQS